MQIKYRGGYKYQLAEDVIVPTSILGYTIDIDFIALDTNGNLLIRKGYAWDGPSGPTYDRPTFIPGSLPHDALSQLMRMELISRSYRKTIDELLRDICIEDGMWAWWAENVVYKGVRIGGNSSTDPANRKEIITAP